VYEGLLPFNQTQGCTLDATNPRCKPSLIAWSSGTVPDLVQTGGFGYFQTKTCSWISGGDVAYCQGEYHEDDANLAGAGMTVSMTATFNDVAFGLRRLDASKVSIEAEDDSLTGTLTTITPTIAAAMNSNGSVTVTISGQLPNIDARGWGTYANYRVRLDKAVIGDHSLLDSTDTTTGWFVRNEWYRLAYFAVARGHTAEVLTRAPLCPTTAGLPAGTPYAFTSSCLSVTNVTPTNSQRAILIIAGRSVNGSPRPSANLPDYFELGNVTGSYIRKTPSTGNVIPVAQRFNDRVLVISSN
jgi:hypothetical protein